MCKVFPTQISESPMKRVEQKTNISRIAEAMLLLIHPSIWDRSFVLLIYREGMRSDDQTTATHSSHKKYAAERIDLYTNFTDTEHLKNMFVRCHYRNQEPIMGIYVCTYACLC